MPLPPGGSTLYRSSIKIENGTYRSAMAMDFNSFQCVYAHFSCLGQSSYPEQIWICLVDSFDYRPVILFRELRLIGWRIGFHFDVREIHRCTPFDQCQHLSLLPMKNIFLPSDSACSFQIRTNPSRQCALQVWIWHSANDTPSRCLPRQGSTHPPLQSFGKEPVFWAVL